MIFAIGRAVSENFLLNPLINGLFLLLFSQVSETPSKSTVIVRKFWSVSEEVDKTLLRQVVQDFCGHFPVFRLQEVDMTMFSSRVADVRDDGRTRFGKCPLDTNKLRQHLLQGCSVMLSSMILKKGIKFSLGLLVFLRLLFSLHFSFNC